VTLARRWLCGVPVFLAALAAAAGSAQPVAPSPSGAGPAATPTTLPSATPSPAATALYHYIWTPPLANPPSPYPGLHAPDLREIDLSGQTLVTPGELRVRVLTSLDVVSVIAHTLGREIGIPRSDPGVFTLDANIPQVPSFLAGRTYDVDFVAAVPDGRTVTVTLPLGLQ
jgi:hypothetical protein